MKSVTFLKGLTIGLVYLALSCRADEPASDIKYDAVVTSYDAARYEFFLQVALACLDDKNQPLCADNLNPSVMLPLRLASAKDTASLRAAFKSEPRVFECDPGKTNACRMELDRSTMPAKNLEIFTDSREELTKLTFHGNVLKIKMRLVINPNQTKTIELCKVSGVSASKKMPLLGSVDAEVIRGVFNYDASNKLAKYRPIVVTVDAMGGMTTNNCEF